MKRPTRKSTRAATMRDVAEAAGVSVSTVSLVINNKEGARIGDDARRRVQEAIDALGYRPNAMAKDLVSGRSRFIGLVADAIASTPFAGQIIHGAQDEAWRHGYVLLVANTEGNRDAETEAIAMMLEHKVRGILYSTWYHREVQLPAGLGEAECVLVNCFAAGWRVRADPEEIAWRESLLEMNRRQQSFRRSLLGEMFITLYYPSASQQIIDWHNEHFQKLGPAKNMEPVIDLVSRIDIREELPKIRAPTLMFHCRLDGNVPVAAGRQAAEAIAGARFVELDSANHFVLGDEPAWQVVAREMGAFLGNP